MRGRRAWRNRSGTVVAQPHHHATPTTLEQIQAEVRRAAEDGERLRVAGGGSAQSPLCWTDETLLSLDWFTGIESVDLDRRRAWVRGGTRLHRLRRRLAEFGLEVPGLPDNDHQTLGGAVALGSHASGLDLRVLADSVTALRLVAADGSVRELDASSPEGLFDAARVSLGALGVVSHLQLQCRDRQPLRLRRRQLRLDELPERLGELLRAHAQLSLEVYLGSGRVQLLTRDPGPPAARPLVAPVTERLRGLAQRSLVELVRHVPTAARSGARLAVRLLPADEHPLGKAAVPPPPTRVRAYALPRARLLPMLMQLERMAEGLSRPPHLPVEVRFLAADPLWLSPAYGQDTAVLRLQALADTREEASLELLAETLERGEARPLWSHPQGLAVAELARRYPRFDAFRALRAEFDPRGVFLNPYLAALFGVSGP
ncbi:MAG TPA: FAD-binding protein [Nevskiaceae bacterium]|nr:FAD-binding protein [Nevskiaceae bacterium]